MKRKDVAIIHWPKEKPSPVLFFDKVIKADAEFLLVIDKDSDISTEDLKVKEDILSFFKKDPDLFIIYGQEPNLFLVRQKILITIFPRVVRIGGDINPEEMLRLEKKKRIEKLVPHVLKLEETISSFKDLLKFLQADPWCRGFLKGCNVAGPYTLLDKSSKQEGYGIMKSKEFVQFRDSIFKKAYDQAIAEYDSWEKYKKEQWKSLLYHGQEDLLDLALALLSSSYRVKYPIPAIDLAAYTIKKFNLDIRLANIPVMGMRFNTRTNENDPNQILSLKVKFDKVSEWQLHFGSHILARCALLDNDPLNYLSKLAQNIDQPYDIISFAEREFNKIINHKCSYEEEADREADKRTEQQSNYINKALEEATDFYFMENLPSYEIKQEIEAEVLIEKEMAEGFKKVLK